MQGDGWFAVTTPAARVPSHGTDMLGQRYAYDFVRLDERKRYHPAGALYTLLLGVPTKECFAWGSPIHSPVDGEVIQAVDGAPERKRVHPVREAFLLLRNALTFRPSKLPAILGNHVIIRSGAVFAAFAHLAPGTVSVSSGQTVAVGEVIGRVGHTGNSTSPHLHFQLMDSADPLTARGIACAFRSYEVERGGSWIRVTKGIPRRDERLRSHTSES